MEDWIIGKVLRQAKGVVHVGAASGQEAEAYWKHGLAVTWIEAIPASYAKLTSNVSAFPNQTAVNALITDRDGEEREFHVASNDGDSSSVFEMAYHTKAWPGIRATETLTLKTRSLDSLLEEGRFACHDLLVLDLQGAEMLALRGAEKLLGQINFVRCEAYGEEMYSGGANVADIIGFLKERGFRDYGTVSWNGLTPGSDSPYFAYELVYARGAA